MKGRLWYSQLDVYDAIRRIASLTFIWQLDVSLSQERLYIADFYLANPPLLHKTHMTRPLRHEFNALEVERPEKSFLRYPSPPLLFQKMAEVQMQAFRTLTAKGLINLHVLARGIVRPSEAGMEVFEQNFLPLLSERELVLARFIANSFSKEGKDIVALRRSTGLRRIGT
jgi:hypothetical protein